MSIIKKTKSLIRNVTHGSSSYFLFGNNGVDICAEACACCWDKPIPDGYEARCNYLKNRAVTGHTSIFEHSNFVIYMNIDASMADDLMEVIDTKRYLESAIRKSSDGKCYYVIIGGSYAGFLHLYNNIKDINNRVLNLITKVIYSMAPPSPFYTLIQDNILDQESFAKILPEMEYHPVQGVETDKYKLVNLDSIDDLKKALNDLCPEPELFDITDLIRFISITVCFKDMSRTGTHQLVRHRNAITQESQRYVDYSKALFADPKKFKPDKYSPENVDYKYHFTFGGQEFDMTLDEIGKAEQAIYPFLINKDLGEYALPKEDARAILPGNVVCKKLYMTFTLKNFFKFLQLREDKHAQAEIRSFATALGEFIRPILGLTPTFQNCGLFDENYEEHDLYEFTYPYYKIKEFVTNIDVPNGKIEEKVFTAEDYINAYPEEFADKEEEKK